MKKSDLVDAVAAKLGGSKGDADKAVDAVLGAIGDGIANDGEVKIQGFGNFKKSLRAARTGRNPATGAAVEIPAKTSVKFKAGKDLEARV
jgi:DNA-binding protein HU-beta